MFRRCYKSHTLCYSFSTCTKHKLTERATTRDQGTTISISDKGPSGDGLGDGEGDGAK